MVIVLRIGSATVAVFCVVYVVATAVLRKWQGGLAEKDINQNATIVGVIAIALLAVILLFAVSNESAPIMCPMLAAIGLGLLILMIGRIEGKTQVRQTPARTRVIYRPPLSTRVPPTVQEDLYRNLLAKVGQDESLAERLIEYERTRTPHASRDDLIRSAIARWERDNR